MRQLWNDMKEANIVGTGSYYRGVIEGAVGGPPGTAVGTLAGGAAGDMAGGISAEAKEY